MAEQIPTAAQSASKLVDMVNGIALDARPRQTMIGIILAPPPNIQVQLNDIILTKEDVYISKYLLIGYERTAKGIIKSETQPRAGGGGYAEFASHTHEINNPYTDNIIYTDTLKPGDRVSVTPVYDPSGQEDQLYIIEDEVVRLT
ncbi:DUF2577 family protein [Veillonella intestinalis]|uniref:DUF2577 family protein n=1 Tax=Veillonella intestinalis TaxID=2941341 RepID=UPI00203E20DE|nr:DUF2577 family protein [Veillonella intestinalis]